MGKQAFQPGQYLAAAAARGKELMRAALRFMAAAAVGLRAA